MLGIYKFEADEGRSGTISGIFLATEEEIQTIKNTRIFLGECLGKHSEVYYEPGELEDCIHLVTTDAVAIETFSKYNLHSGYDLTNYLYEDEE